MNQKAPGSTVLRMVANGMNILNIEVETDWAPDEIKELAREEGYAVNAANGRFQKVAKAKPAPVGIVRVTPKTDTGAEADPAPSATASGNEPSIVAPALVSPPVAPRRNMPPADVPPAARVTLDPAPTISAGLAHADEHIRSLATTARDTITALAAALVEYEQRGQALAEVARLEEELAAAKVRAGLGDVGQPTPVTAVRRARAKTSDESKRIRAWAAENGVPCTRTGIVPRHVVEQYRAATEAGAA